MTFSKLAIVAGLVAAMTVATASAAVGVPPVFSGCDPNQWDVSVFMAGNDVHIPCESSRFGPRTFQLMRFNLQPDDTCTAAKPDNVDLQGKGTVTFYFAAADVTDASQRVQEKCLDSTVAVTVDARLCGNELSFAKRQKTGTLASGETYNIDDAEMTFPLPSLKDGGVFNVQETCVYMKKLADGSFFGGFFRGLPVADSFTGCNRDDWSKLLSSDLRAMCFGDKNSMAMAVIPWSLEVQAGASCPTNNADAGNALVQGVYTATGSVSVAKVAGQQDQMACLSTPYEFSQTVSICAHHLHMGGGDSRTIQVDGQTYNTIKVDPVDVGVSINTDAAPYLLGADNRCFPIFNQDGHLTLLEWHINDKNGNTGCTGDNCGCQGNNCGCQGNNCGNNDCSRNIPNLFMFNGLVVTDQAGHCDTASCGMMLGGKQYYKLGNAGDLHMRQGATNCGGNNGGN